MNLSKYKKLNKAQHSFVWNHFWILNDGNSDAYVDKYFCKPCLEQGKRLQKAMFEKYKGIFD